MEKGQDIEGKEENIDELFAESLKEIDDRITILEKAEKSLTKAEIEELVKKYSEGHKKSLIAELRKIINEP